MSFEWYKTSMSIRKRIQKNPRATQERMQELRVKGYDLSSFKTLQGPRQAFVPSVPCTFTPTSMADHEAVFSGQYSGLSSNDMIVHLVTTQPMVTFLGSHTAQVRGTVDGNMYVAKVMLRVSRVLVTLFVKESSTKKMELFEKVHLHIGTTLNVEINEWKALGLDNVMLPLAMTEDRVIQSVWRHGKLTVFGPTVHLVLTGHPEVAFKMDVSVEREIMLRMLGPATLEQMRDAWNAYAKLVKITSFL